MSLVFMFPVSFVTVSSRSLKILCSARSCDGFCQFCIKCIYSPVIFINISHLWMHLFTSCCWQELQQCRLRLGRRQQCVGVHLYIHYASMTAWPSTQNKNQNICRLHKQTCDGLPKLETNTSICVVTTLLTVCLQTKWRYMFNMQSKH